MSGKAGQKWRNPGPRTVAADFGVGDPANGERVVRCAICGLPETPGNKLLPGLWGYIRFNLDLVLCERCVVRHRRFDPRDADPLTLEDVA
jgi:hypothetical protein